MIKFNFLDVNNALEYYGINDTDYRNKCYECIKELNSIKDFNNKAEQIYNILYTDKTREIRTLWKKENMIELFGERYNPFVTNILVLLGYKIHDNNMKKKKYNDQEIELYKKRVYETLTNDIRIKKLEGIRIEQMLWAIYFINSKLIEVGRLQYEKYEDYIKIHIPSGEKLKIESVINSIKDSKVQIQKYFELYNPEYYCNSWLLSNQINEIIDSNCNIHKFYKLFEVKDGTDAIKDILNFVFNVQECDNHINLPENTSLQKVLKSQLLNNKKLKIGCGKLIRTTL